MPVTSVTTGLDQGKYISEKLIERSELLHRLPQLTNPVPLPKGVGKTVEMIRYNRTEIVVDKLIEGVTPNEIGLTVGTQTVSVDQWGMYMTLTDVVEVTTKHPVFNEAIDLLGDAQARMQDHQIADVLMAGTNVQYWDGTRANRAAITATDTFKALIFNKSRVDLNDAAVPARDGAFYVIVTDSAVEADILGETAAGGFTDVARMQDKESLEKGTVGAWLGFRIVRTNFIPKFTRLTTVSAPVAGAGGALTGTIYHKVTRKSLMRGFEEDIAVEGSTAMAANTRLTFTLPVTAGYVYNIYVGSATGDANLFLAAENRAAGAVVNIDGLVGAGKTAPPTPAAGVVVHVAFVFAAGAVDKVEMTSLNVKGMITKKESTDTDPLQQRRKMGSKWMDKAAIRDQTRFKRIELASAF
jgi:N4-gp56 family major capsid protein